MTNSFRFKGFDPVFFISHLLFLGFSYSIYLAPHIAPSTFPYLGFVPIFYPLIFIANLFLLLVLFWRNKAFGIVFTLFSIGLIFPLSKSYQFFGDKLEAESDFKLITYNANYLRTDGFDEFFNHEDADIILFQEVINGPLFKELKEAAFKGYYFESDVLTQIVSKYPIIEFKVIFTGKNNQHGNAFYADLDTGTDTIRVLNVYLEPMQIDKELVKQSINVQEDKEQEKSKLLINKLTRGFLYHENQIKKIIPYISNSPHPIILAGDLNSVPNSYEYEKINFWLNDAYMKVGRKPGTTFHDYKYPIRIDYIFHSSEIIPIRYEIRKDIDLSDHYPVVGYFKLP